jgi:hypothetical protein
MARRAARSAEPAGVDWPIWLPRAGAVVVFIAGSAALYHLLNLPAARPVEDVSSVTMVAGDEVTFIAPEAGPVLSFNGPVGKGVAVRFSRAALSANTTTQLKAFGIAAPQGEDRLQWVTHDGGGGRATLNLTLTPVGPHPTLAIESTGGDAVAELAFRAHDARLKVSLSSAMAGAEAPNAEVFPGSGEPFELGGGGAFPLAIEAPAGAAFTLRFAQAAADGATFRWGRRPDEDRHLSRLQLAGLRLRRPGEADRLYACGAPDRTISWMTTKVEAIACQPTLSLQSLDLSRDAAVIAVRGPAFVAVRGEPQVHSWKVITSNPLLAGLLGAAYAAIVTWTLRTVFAKPASRPSSKRRRRAAKTA